MPEKWAACVAAARMAMASKSLWRTLLALLVFTLIFTIFNPAHPVLSPNTFGWTPNLHLPHSSDSPPPFITPSIPADGVDWTQYAYCQYVTNLEYLCNSVMIFEALVRLGAKADRFMMYPQQWKVDMDSPQGKLLCKARDEYGVKLVPIHVEHHPGETTWAESFTKLLAFNQTQYKRVLSLDSDATVLQPMDELFLLPSAPVAMPRAYWLNKEKDKRTILSSQLVLVEPSTLEFERIQDAFKTRQNNDFDMEIVNDLYGQQCIIIPHRRYDMLTGEFRGKGHANYLGSEKEVWSTAAALAEVKFVHFSDWPLPKPWKHISQQQFDSRQPDCHEAVDGVQDCSEREAWLGLYSDFKERRAKVCG